MQGIELGLVACKASAMLFTVFLGLDENLDRKNLSEKGGDLVERIFLLTIIRVFIHCLLLQLR